MAKLLFEFAEVDQSSGVEEDKVARWVIGSKVVIVLYTEVNVEPVIDSIL